MVAHVPSFPLPAFSSLHFLSFPAKERPITNEGDLSVRNSILVDIDQVWSHIKSLYKLSDNVITKRIDALMFTKKQILSEI